MRGLALSVAVSLVFAASGHAVKTPPVTNIKVTPTPFYDDVTTMRVSFETAKRTTAGFVYEVEFDSQAPQSVRQQSPGCALFSEVLDDSKKVTQGGANAVVHFALGPDKTLESADHFCPGPGQIQVWLWQRAPHLHRVAKITSYSFRVLRAP